MTKRIGIPSKDIALTIVGPLGDYLAARIQRLDIPVNFPATDIDELGNPQHAGTVADIPEITSTFQAMDVSIKLFAALTGTDAASFPGAGVDISDLGKVDLIGNIKDKDVADFVKNVHVKKAQITGFTFTYSVDAESTEEYNLTATRKRWLKNDVIVDTFDVGQGSPATLSETPLQLKSNDYCLSVILDGEYLDEVVGAPASGEYSVAGTDLSFADAIASKLVAVYHASPAGNNWTDVSDSTIPAGIRGKDAVLKLAANDIERVQNVTIRGTFPSTPVKELGSVSLVGTLINVPQVTGDITVLDTDLELIALFTTGDPASADTEFRDCEFTASGISLEVTIRDPATDPCGDAGVVLKTVYIPEMIITSEGHAINVGGNANQTFAFRSKTGQCLIYSGSR